MAAGNDGAVDLNRPGKRGRTMGLGGYGMGVEMEEGVGGSGLMVGCWYCNGTLRVWFL